jgi:hypothetical protein
MFPASKLVQHAENQQVVSMVVAAKKNCPADLAV